MSSNKKATPSEQSLLISTLHYRKVVGFMGLFLTPALYLFSGAVIPHSISSYYHTGAGTLFVGTLCAIGVFLCCYKGYDLGDHVGSGIAGAAAVLVGLCPTASEGAVGHEVFIGNIHWGSAFTFFLAITYLCWFQFTRTEDRAVLWMSSKWWRNLIYRSCAGVMLACLGGLLLYYLWKDKVKAALSPLEPVLLFETLAIMAFGLAWLVKGEGIAWDRGRNWFSGEMGPARKAK